MRKFVKRLLDQVRISSGMKDILSEMKALRAIEVEKEIDRLLSQKKYKDIKKLNIYEAKIFSQFGEDGIVEEIFKRIGTTNKYFVEIGSEDGLENNTAYWLCQGWKGLWVEGNNDCVVKIKTHLTPLLKEGWLQVHQEYINGNTIDEILKKYKCPKETDLLSIDIDSEDFEIWEAIKNIQPRVVVIEYNAVWGKKCEWVMKKKDLGTANFGASLKALEGLGKRKGYKLVGCNLAGNNAFFVRSDLVKTKFAAPFTSENHYEPPRYYLTRYGGYKKSYEMIVANWNSGKDAGNEFPG